MYVSYEAVLWFDSIGSEQLYINVYLSHTYIQQTGCCVFHLALRHIDLNHYGDREKRERGERVCG